MSIYVSGSLAFDRIMTFPGNFQDHILMDKLHMINVSFMVDGMDERRGGCAGNIAYSLALLEEKPVIVAAAGRDFDSYAQTLAAHGLPLDGIRHADEVFTALSLSPEKLELMAVLAVGRPASKGASSRRGLEEFLLEPF